MRPIEHHCHPSVEWNQGAKDYVDLVAVLTLVGPAANVLKSVTKSHFAIIKAEIEKASLALENGNWKEFSAKTNFFQLFEEMIEITAKSIDSKIRGLLKSKLRSLAIKVENNKSVKVVQIYSKSFDLDDNFHMFIGVEKINESNGLQVEFADFVENFKKLEVN